MQTDVSRRSYRRLPFLILLMTLVILLIGVNSCGDYVYSWQYGFWGATGFTLVVLFVTFCAGLLAVMCFMHAVEKMKSA